MEYCNVKLTLKAPENQSPSVSFNGKVTFNPDIGRGETWHDNGVLVPSVRVDAAIVNNVLQGADGKNLVKLMAGGVGVNPEQVYWRIAFDDIYLGEQRVHIDPFVFEAVPGATLDLEKVTPVAGYTPPGIIKGEKGEIGLSFKGVFNNESELPSSSEKGDAWANLSTKDLHIWNGSKWEVVTDFGKVDVSLENINEYVNQAKQHAANSKTSETNSKTSENNSLSYAQRAEFAAEETIQQVEGDFATRNYVDTATDAINWHRGNLPENAVVDDMRLDEHKGGWSLDSTQATEHSMPSDGFGMLFVQHLRGIAGYANAIQVWESALRNDRWTRGLYRDGAWTEWLKSATSADVESMTTTAVSTAGTKWIGYEQYANDLLRTDARGQLEVSTPSITGNGNITNKRYVDDAVASVKWLRGDFPDGAVIDDYRLVEHAGGWTLTTTQARSYNLPDAGFGLLHVLHVRGIPGYAYAIQAWESTTTGTRWTRTKRSDGPWSAWQAPGGGGGAVPADTHEPVAVGMKNADLMDEFVARKGGTIGTGGCAAFALRLDHGTNAFRDELGSILKKYGLPATMAVYSEQREVNPDNNSVAWGEVESWHHSHGMSFGNHSDDHLDKPDAEGWYGGTIGSHQALTNLMPKVPIEQYMPHGSVGFERYGGFNQASSHELIVGTLAGRMALSTHALISGYRGGRYRNLIGKPMQGLTHWSMEESTPATFRSVIDAAIDQGRGVAVMFHPEFIGRNRKMTWEQIDECLAYVAQKRDEGVLVPLTLDGLAVAEYRSDYRDDLLTEDLALMQNGAKIYGNFTETPGAFTSSTPGNYVRHLVAMGNTPEIRGGIRTAEWHISSTAGGSARISANEAVDDPSWESQREVTFPAGESVLYLPFGIPLDVASMRIQLTLLGGDITIHETHAYST